MSQLSIQNRTSKTQLAQFSIIFILLQNLVCLHASVRLLNLKIIHFSIRYSTVQPSYTVLLNPFLIYEFVHCFTA